MRIDIDPAQTDRDVFYRLLTATVVPRPIAWVSTTNSSGSCDNLAPAKFGEKRYR
jgi:flavin reductase (DIM6/NTAB) family NADH-FMN oxidoreductase RutF